MARSQLSDREEAQNSFCLGCAALMPASVRRAQRRRADAVFKPRVSVQAWTGEMRAAEDRAGRTLPSGTRMSMLLQHRGNAGAHSLSRRGVIFPACARLTHVS